MNKEGMTENAPDEIAGIPPEPAHQGLDENQTSANYHQKILDAVPDWVWEIDQYGFITYSNPRVQNLLGYAPGKLEDKSFLHLVPKSDSINARTLLSEDWERQGNAVYLKHYLVSKDGNKVLFETTGSVFLDTLSNKQGTRFFSRPVDTEQSSEERKNKMAMFAANNISQGIAIANSEMIITYVNSTMTEIFGYTEDELIGEPLTILGTDNDTDLVKSKAVSAALRSDACWDGEARRKHKNGEYIPCIISARAIDNKNGQTICYIGTYMDKRPLQKSSAKIQNSLKKVINTICNAIEDRNVIKSQHQERVTDLAVAIAIEMGASVHFIEGLSLACQLHDLGEMYIPPEIATRVGKLSDADFEMIKTHPKKGYELLKSMNLEWPVADIVLQHHERMDGSGYPYQLRGDEIMLEARILAVSDVVETMLTDRPYRSACSLDQCLAELSENKGKLYDYDVVDTCIQLIRENHYFLKRL